MKITNSLTNTNFNTSDFKINLSRSDFKKLIKSTDEDAQRYLDNTYNQESPYTIKFLTHVITPMKVISKNSGVWLEIRLNGDESSEKYDKLKETIANSKLADNVEINEIDRSIRIEYTESENIDFKLSDLKYLKDFTTNLGYSYTLEILFDTAIFKSESKTELSNYEKIYNEKQDKKTDTNLQKLLKDF